MGDIKYSELQLKSADGTDLFTRVWCPEETAKAWIAFSHGQSEHSGRYDTLGQKLAGAGYALVMADLHGHGKSGGKRGHVDRFSQYTDDLQAAIDYAKEQNPSALFIGGHSLGGLNAARVSVENPEGVRGLILSGAFLRLGFEPPAWKMTMGRILARLLPKLAMGNEVNVSDLTHDEEIVNRQKNDPLNHGLVSTRALVEMLQAQADVFEKADMAKMAMLVMHGDQDALAAVSGSEDFHRLAGSQAKTLKIYEGFYHEIFNELDRDRVFKDVIEWLDSLTA
jgi:alpha-beta hydrolase superfamily lysophospholipase